MKKNVILTFLLFALSCKTTEKNNTCEKTKSDPIAQITYNPSYTVDYNDRKLQDKLDELSKMIKDLKVESKKLKQTNAENTSNSLAKDATLVGATALAFGWKIILELLKKFSLFLVEKVFIKIKEKLIVLKDKIKNIFKRKV